MKTKDLKIKPGILIALLFVSMICCKPASQVVSTPRQEKDAIQPTPTLKQQKDSTRKVPEIRPND